ncbi:hypothetical protein D039_3966A, partial [Vibrio parahaemolyticus EKP-028]
MSPNT